MSTLVASEQGMAKTRKNMPVRIDEEALRWARIAASYKGMTLADYVSASLLGSARADVDRSHAEISAEAKKPKGKGAK